MPGRCQATEMSLSIYHKLPIPVAEYISIPIMLLPYEKSTLKLFYRPVILKYMSKWTVWYHFKSLLTLSFNLP